MDHGVPAEHGPTPKKELVLEFGARVMLGAAYQAGLAASGKQPGSDRPVIGPEVEEADKMLIADAGRRRIIGRVLDGARKRGVLAKDDNNVWSLAERSDGEQA